MKISHKNTRGFTLVEMMMVLGIFSLVSTALYGLYITHLRTASHHDQLLEVQQNMRIALDSISRDLLMAGMLTPNNYLSGTMGGVAVSNVSSPITVANPSDLTFITNSADRIFARITHTNRSGVAAFTNLTTSVDPGSFLDLNVGDRVRIIRASTVSTSEPLRAQFAMGDYTTMVVATSPVSGVISLTRANSSSSFDSTISLNMGDLIAKKGGYNASPPKPATPDTVRYYLATGNSCPAGQTCLFRSVNGDLPGDLVAGYLKSLDFTYNNTVVAGQPTLVSIGVKLVGTTTAVPGRNQPLVTREMDTLIKLRK
jgi:prepilin-type N-terminal cleavage/methylation domain-containing protein